MYENYIYFVKNFLLFSAFIQFAILGTFGEYIGIWIEHKKVLNPFNLRELILKVIGWGVLGIIIKYAFTGFWGFTEALITKGLLPTFFSGSFLYALSTSIFTNTLFGPQMMLFHRFTDNIIMRRNSYQGIKNSILTLFWFWIPAHTVTFILPKHFQIGLAALWSVVLGIILGFFKRISE
ncbi:MAG: hypothetical protein FXF47_08815 [Candidatus Mcinerneyibacterium aminivorans]|uniref:Mpv17/PMP22 family protein n=1 Tax=Candidatus Mcinerneyibacterium aminivorans TaxID=2703815 RepID=A0A5D0M9T4_9BACT|nr:MAG: hypothetical protein FXF47_08815 [Candidatus Mcinerneyibacterium aminivorans]